MKLFSLFVEQCNYPFYQKTFSKSYLVSVVYNFSATCLYLPMISISIAMCYLVFYTQEKETPDIGSLTNRYASSM